MRLIAADPEGQRDVMNLRGDELVNGTQLFIVGREGFGKLSGLAADFGSHIQLGLLQTVVPARNLVPSSERSYLNRRGRNEPPWHIGFLTLRIRSPPCVNLVCAILSAHGLVIRAADFDVLVSDRKSTR